MKCHFYYTRIYNTVVHRMTYWIISGGKHGFTVYVCVCVRVCTVIVWKMILGVEFGYKNLHESKYNNFFCTNLYLFYDYTSVKAFVRKRQTWIFLNENHLDLSAHTREYLRLFDFVLSSPFSKNRCRQNGIKIIMFFFNWG